MQFIPLVEHKYAMYIYFSIQPSVENEKQQMTQQHVHMYEFNTVMYICRHCYRYYMIIILILHSVEA